MFHRRYDVYTKSLEATRLANAMIRRFPPGHAWLADQLRRAIASAPLNVAEGLHRSTRPDRERFFSFARGNVWRAVSSTALICFDAFAHLTWCRGKNPRAMVTPK